MNRVIENIKMVSPQSFSSPQALVVAKPQVFCNQTDFYKYIYDQFKNDIPEFLRKYPLKKNESLQFAFGTTFSQSQCTIYSNLRILRKSRNQFEIKGRISLFDNYNRYGSKQINYSGRLVDDIFKKILSTL